MTDILKDVIEVQQEHFRGKPAADDADASDADAPPEPVVSQREMLGEAPRSPSLLRALRSLAATE